MPLLSVDNISKSFGDRCLLDGVSFRINEGDKIAFIGCNGAGKSTLFKMIKGVERVDSGRIILHGNTIVGFLSQNMEEQDLSENTLKPKALIEAEERKTELENEISMASGDSEKLDSLMREYSEVTARYEALGGYDYDHRIMDALSGLGLTGIDGRTDLSSLSGGEKMRVCLARLIVERPDILLLDEPTNHLDIDAVEWLEGFLKSYGGAVFVISHDRYFIDRISNRIIELQDARIREYRGNYESYKIQKEEFLKTQEAVVANLEKELEHQLDVKQTMLSHRNISGYHQREKMVDKLMAVLDREKAMLPSMSGSMSFTPMPAERSGAEDKILLQVRDVSKRFDENVVFEHISFELKANMKIFLCGPNGCGKTTLLTMLLGRQGGFDGTVFISGTATMGYMAQFVPFDDEELTCYDELIARSDLTNTQARSMLARFGFRGEDVFKKISVLSGGERSRLYLCCLLQENPDILFLDEPTNHLDIDSREILEDALKEYNGAIVCVSHDRFFIEKCADKVLGFIGGTAEMYDKYEYYRRAVNSNKAAATEQIPDKPAEEKVSRETDGKIQSRNKASERKEAARRRERMAFLEKEIERLEEEQRTLEVSFTTGAGADEYRKYADNSHQIEQMYEEYMELEAE